MQLTSFVCRKDFMCCTSTLLNQDLSISLTNKTLNFFVKLKNSFVWVDRLEPAILEKEMILVFWFLKKYYYYHIEKYFQNKNETLIGIIDYEFDKEQRRKIKNISINPKQTKNVKLDQGDRLITIANFNDLEMVNQSRYLHIL